MLVELIAIFVLLLLSGFFSGSETALTAASTPLMHQLEQKGNSRAALVNQLHEKKTRLIGTILLGNNLVNILASALATSILIFMFGEAGVAYATIGMTLLVLIFSEIMPKTYAIKHANRMALFVAPIINTLMILLSPFTKSINLVVRILFRIFGVNIKQGESFVSPEEELRGAIELHEGEDALEARQERDMMRSVLDLGDVWVGEIMTHRKDVVAINADDDPKSIVDQVLAASFTRLPLWRENPDEVVGTIHAKDLLRAVWGRDEALEGMDVVALAAKPWFIPESTTLLDQLEAFRRRREHFALVVDEYGSLMGVVTLEDILEEIVGDISDEHDVFVPGVRPGLDGTILVQGSVTIRDLNRKYEWSLPDEEAATIAGLVLHEARRIPKEGQAFLFHGFRFEIVRRERHQITLIRITPPGTKAA